MNNETKKAHAELDAMAKKLVDVGLTDSQAAEIVYVLNTQLCKSHAAKTIDLLCEGLASKSPN